MAKEIKISLNKQTFITAGIFLLVIAEAIQLWGIWSLRSTSAVAPIAPVAQRGDSALPSQPAGGPVAPVNQDDHQKGPKNAKVTLIEYSDFECTFCLNFEETLQRIEAEYADKVLFVYRHFPLTSIHPEAQKAAEASECAAQQGKFWEMHNKIFLANGAGNMSVGRWKEAAREIGLNTAKFNTCLDGGATASEVAADFNSGSSAGVTGTPATFINGQLYSGALPYESIKQAIDTALAAS